MGYFEEHYSCVRYPAATEGSKGLRRPQLGAIHAVAAHFTQHTDPSVLHPAIVVMPTGSGKTEVLMLSPFVLRTRRTLVVTPTRMIRAQVAEKFKDFGVLPEVGALSGDLAGLRVRVQQNKIVSQKAWEELSSSDVVISTPNCISPAYDDIPDPPPDLFDLLLVDEAHHEPARTWKAILDAFPTAGKILFTATPFRGDKLEIEGQIVYDFSIQEAYKDGIYGEIEFEPVQVRDEPSEDVAVARRTEEIYERDQSLKFEHRILVRTNTQKHARELKKVYDQYTHLHLRVLLGKHSARYVNQTVGKLQRRELDGVICVDMLGEGFDYPNLKIAAIHAPYKSLAATLQFIGRFARTGSEKLGQATFIAIPQHVTVGTEQLYREEKAWQQIIPNLYESQVEHEFENRRAISTYRTVQAIGSPGEEEEQIRELSLYPLTPFHHVKIYRLLDGGDIDKALELENYDILRQDHSDELSSVIMLIKEVDYPDWLALDLFPREQYHLVIAYYSLEDQLLFINSSRKSTALYETIAEQISQGRFEPLPIYTVDRVLSRLEGASLFNVGLRNRLPNTQVESYRILAGSGVQKAITRADGRLFHRGHVFGGGRKDGNRVTLGYSSSAKVWSNKHSSVIGLVRWCKDLAHRISTDDRIKTGTNFDEIPVGERLTNLAGAGLLGVDWNAKIYLNPPQVQYVGDDGFPRTIRLLDLDLNLDRDHISTKKARIEISGDDLAWVADYSPEYPFFEQVSCTASEIAVHRGYRSIDLVAFLNEYPCSFFTVDQALIVGSDIFRCNAELAPYDTDLIQTVRWEIEGVDIQTEAYETLEEHEPRSIHEYLADRLVQEAAEIVFYDHGSGEIADFVTFERRPSDLLVTLYHVKASGGEKPSEKGRVGDVYEVCGQVVKSFIWLNREELWGKIHYRFNSRSSQFIKGDLLQLQELLENTASIAATYRTVIVQPGIKREPLQDKIAYVLAAANEYAIRAGYERMEVLASD